VFAVLGILTYISFKHSFARVATYSLLFCALYAICDETHQVFVSGRAFEYADLLLDIYGSLVGISLLKLRDMMERHEQYK
jgi:VanZ family protein